MDEALDHAVALMTADGVGALSVSEVARRMGIRGPSLYKYFPSRHAMYDALFARGLAEQLAAVRTADRRAAAAGCRGSAPAAAAVVRWAVAEPGPGPAAALAARAGLRALPRGLRRRAWTTWPTSAAEFAEAVRLGQLRDAAADADDTVRLYTVVLSGLISQQLANQPGRVLRRGRLQPAHRHRDSTCSSPPTPPEESPCRPWTATRSAPSSPPRPRTSTPWSPT